MKYAIVYNEYYGRGRPPEKLKFEIELQTKAELSKFLKGPHIYTANVNGVDLKLNGEIVD